jgi:hypothetical protein
MVKVLNGNNQVWKAAQREEFYNTRREATVLDLHVSQDPITRNGQHAISYWEMIHKHYLANQPSACDEQPSRSLEIK